MSKKLYEESDVQAIANAIRTKNGLTDTYTVSQMAAAVLAISSVADHTVEDAIITRTITEYSNDRITSLGFYAFARCYNLTKVDLPNLKESGSNSIFQDCKSLVSVNIPLAEKLGTSAFDGCTSLTTINLPSVTNLGVGVFNGCTSLATINLPVVTYVGNTFPNCTSLTMLDFPLLRIIQHTSFKGCTSLSYLILRKADLVCSLANVNAFTNTPIESGTGYIYVPSALIDTYKTATNWVTFADQFRALEDYTVDGTTTGELDESKVNV